MDIIITNTKVTCVKDVKVTDTSMPRMLKQVARKCFQRKRPETQLKKEQSRHQRQRYQRHKAHRTDIKLSHKVLTSPYVHFIQKASCLSQAHKDNVQCNAEWKRQQIIVQECKPKLGRILEPHSCKLVTRRRIKRSGQKGTVE